MIGEIRGATRPDEIVLIGAHLDSWDLGTGALDNGANVAMVHRHRASDAAARPPARRAPSGSRCGTARSRASIGSFGYTQTHAAELDRHVMASSYDIGTGRIIGFFTGGRPEMPPPSHARSRR